VFKLILRYDFFALGAFACTRRTKDDEIKHVNGQNKGGKTD